MFQSVVNLYRALGKPSVTDDSTYSFDGPITPVVRALIEDYRQINFRFGEIDVSQLSDSHAKIEVNLPRGDVGKFYSTIESFLTSTSSIAVGSIPENYYILEEDYLSGDLPKPIKLRSLESLTEFIKLLTLFSEDIHDLSGSGVRRLLFVLPPDGRIPQKTVVVPVVLEASALDNELNHYKILESLVSPSNEKKLHIEERRLVMKIAISDVLNNANSEMKLLTFLVKNWNEVLRKYRYNFQAYINKFAFDDIRKKIADAEIEYASKLSGVLGDIAGKLLALPVSLLGVIALEQAKSDFAFWSGCAGLFIVSLIYCLVLYNQNQQVSRLENSFNLIFSPFFNKINTYPKALRDALSQRKNGTAKQLLTLKWTFRIFYFLAMVPTIGAAYQAYIRFNELPIKAVMYVLAV
ncbi:MAG: hypothetical protein H7240_09035 [Glaciimonas sp.]|nr:hypothetical protein [Glaciimonas sp.]